VSPRAAATVAARGRRAPLLLVTAAAAVAAAAVLPLAYLVVRALSADAESRSLVPLDTTLELVVDTAVLAVGVVAAGLVVGVPFAWLVVRTDLPWRRAWSVAGALPLVIPSFVAALALLGAFAPRGLLQQALEPLGVERLPDISGYWGSLLALTLSTYPYVFLIVAAGLRAADPSIEEAARSVGAGRLRVLFRITLPSIQSAIAAAATLVALYVLADFGAVSLMGYPTLTTSIYVRYESLLDRDAAAVLSLVLVALAGVVVLVAAHFRSRGAGHRSTPGAGRNLPPTPLGVWRWPAVTFCAAVTGLFLVVPLCVLVWWSAQGTAGVEIPWDAARNTVVAAALAASCAAIVVLPTAVLAWRHPSPLSRTLERLTLLPTALPGIAIALALVFFGARVGGVLYQSFALLLFAYLVRFMPYSLASTRASLDTVNPRLEDAARSLGQRRPQVLRRVILPLARPGVLAGAALVFLSTLKELPITLILRPTGFDTLATEIWTQTSISAYAAVAPSALLLVAIAAPLVYLSSWRAAWDLGAPD
jgi:iron(III) transport system permease protein